jgi:glycosyltransferase involved in cell wall biosynthesis
MRLVDVPSGYPPHPGGLEMYAHELHRRLLAADPDLRITVLASEMGSRPGPERLADRWTVVRWPAWEPVSPYPVPKRGFHSLLREYATGPDTVVMTHTRFFVHAAMVGRWARRRGLRHIHVEHGSSPVQSGNVVVRAVANMVDRTIGRALLRSATEVIAVSESARQFVRDLAGRDPIVVHRGIELPEGLRSNPVSDVPTLCFLGRLISGKGASDLITAVGMLRSAGLAVRLRLCGDGPARALLEQQIRALGLTSEVTLLGAVDHPTALRELADATVFVNPSWTEGLPTTVLEAAALGCCVVATDVGGTSEIVTSGETGWLVPAREPERLAAAIREAIERPDLRAARAALLGDVTRERFSWEHATAVVSSLLRGVPASRAN